MFKSRAVTVAILMVLFAVMAGNPEKIFGAQAGIPKTGQTTSYATGDDGDLQMGIAWPDPRFTDNGNGTVTDNLSGLIWTKNAQQISGQMIWTQALTACNTLALNGYDDWRMPNIRELSSLLDYGATDPAVSTSHPFMSVQNALYWSSTTHASDNAYAWDARMDEGHVVYGSKTDSYYVWPVMGETSGAAGIPKTGQKTSYATGDDGDLQMGIAWPDPRFTDNGNGTVTDNLSGLIWTKNAQQISGQMVWNDALGACDSLVFAGYDDWRLPNVRELQSLVDYGQSGPPLPEDHPFENLLGACKSSTTFDGDTSRAWTVRVNDTGVANIGGKDNYAYVWAVRGHTVPLPGTMILLGSGLVGLVVSRRKFRTC